MSVQIKEYDHVPETLQGTDHALFFPAKHQQSSYYRWRTNRNIGWITDGEQETLRHAVVGIAGTGGMGGLLAATLVRLGVGEIRIADSEMFDVSNLNRQFGATRLSVGRSKALETARLIRDIADDTDLIVYPQGITADTVDDFIEGCTVICDEIEFWALGSRILLHEKTRLSGVSLFNCNSVGFASHLFLFRPDSVPIEKLVGVTRDEAYELERKIQNEKASANEISRVMECMLRILVPRLPEYCSGFADYRTADAVRERLFGEQQASIIATNPPFATGFLANHVLLYLLRNSRIERTTIAPPEPPGYLYLDSVLMQARSITY
ncbi:MAG: ThiF family adenylyltransferase [Candidatus Pacebacteria bacterium]|nr:ThiF family adenylyltransferase [Candidatus Paceibacterota bacterium]